MEPVYGKACVKCGPRNLGWIQYKVEVGMGGHLSIVKFDHPPNAEDGDTLHLTLEDGRMLDCQVIDSSPYCAVVGEGPYQDRRTQPRNG